MITTTGSLRHAEPELPGGLEVFGSGASLVPLENGETHAIGVSRTGFQQSHRLRVRPIEQTVSIHRKDDVTFLKQ